MSARTSQPHLTPPAPLAPSVSCYDLARLLPGIIREVDDVPADRTSELTNVVMSRWTAIEKTIASLPPVTLQDVAAKLVIAAGRLGNISTSDQEDGEAIIDARMAVSLSVLLVTRMAGIDPDEIAANSYLFPAYQDPAEVDQ